MIRFLEKNKEISFILTFLITIEIFYVSSISGTSFGKIGSNLISILYHFIVFFLFTFFLFITIKGNKKIKSKYLLIVLIIAIIQAFLDEFHQIFVPFRDASIRDILIDAIGIFSAIIIYSHINKKIKR